MKKEISANLGEDIAFSPGTFNIKQQPVHRFIPKRCVTFAVNGSTFNGTLTIYPDGRTQSSLKKRSADDSPLLNQPLRDPCQPEMSSGKNFFDAVPPTERPRSRMHNLLELWGNPRGRDETSQGTILQLLLQETGLQLPRYKVENNKGNVIPQVPKGRATKRQKTAPVPAADGELTDDCEWALCHGQVDEEFSSVIEVSKKVVTMQDGHIKFAVVQTWATPYDVPGGARQCFIRQLILAPDGKVTPPSFRRPV